jgi:4-hydroxy-3-polyprenylbenzoate decarboxylase
MIVLPCTVGSLAAIANGFCGNLLHRCADVALKERRPLLLAVRETPLNRTHLTNMLAAHEAGAIICPPMPSFYTQPKGLDDIARNFAARICDQLGIEVTSVHIRRWQGI